MDRDQERREPDDEEGRGQLQRPTADSKVRHNIANDNICVLRSMRSEGDTPGDPPGQETVMSDDEQGGGECEDLRADPVNTRRDVPEDKYSLNLSTKKSPMKIEEEDFCKVGRDRQTLRYHQQRQNSRNIPHGRGEIDTDDNTFGGRRRV